MRTSFFQCVLFFLVLVTVANAQVDQGQISGTITDSSQAVVPGATVTVVNIQTRASQSAQAGQNGAYVITNLFLGDYTVTAEAPGFKKFTRTNVRVNAASRTTVDISLEVGAPTDSVTVTDTAAQMQEETAQIGRVVESRQITDLALNGRNPINLALLKAGVVGGNFNSFNADSLTNGGFSINGGDANSNAITLDGVNIMRTRGGEAAVGVGNVDTLQEVQILTSSYPAEYGRTKDGQIRFVTKSGTPEFHGTAYNFFRNSALDANSWTRNQSPNIDESRRPAPFRFNQPGYTIGGPIYIPGKFNTNKNKLFFLVSQEWIRYRRETTATATVPSLLMRKGDFSELLNPQNPFFNRVRIIRNPTTGQPYEGNKITQGLSPNGMALMNAWPLPTPGFQLGTANWIQSRPDPRNSAKNFVRVDYYTGMHRITFSANAFSFKEDEPFYSGLDIAPTRFDRPNYSGTISVTSTISPALINDFSFNGAVDIVRLDLHETDGKKLWERSLYGVNFPYIFPAADKIVPNRITEIVSVTGFSNLTANNRPASSSGPMYTWTDNLTWMASSSHIFKFGVNIAREENNNNDQTNDQSGTVTFLDTGNPLSTGLALANLALGNFDTYAETGKVLYTLARSTAFEAYGQDTWKVTPKLTLELGVRYSYYQPWYAKWNDFANFSQEYYKVSNRPLIDPRAGFVISGDRYNGIVLPGDGYPPEAQGRFPGTSDPDTKRLFHNLPRALVNSYKNAFAPRFGLAYRIGGKTVIRLGGGVFHQRLFLDTNQLIKMPPNTTRADVLNGKIDFPGGAEKRDYLFTVRSSDWDAKYPTAYNFSFSIQRQIPGAILMDVSYVGKISNHLPRNRNLNQLQPGTRQANPGIDAGFLRPYFGLGQFSHREYTGRTNYNSLQVAADRRFTAGLGFGVAYTFSKNLDDIKTPYNAYRFDLMRSLANLDRTHLLNLNYVYELPILRNRKDWLGNAFGNWQISGVTFYRSGAPLSVTDSTDVAGIGPGSAAAPWNLVGDTKVSGERGLNQLWFNPLAFALPAAGTFGNAGINILRGPGFQNWDLALFKTFRILERLRSEFRIEVFNLPNYSVLDNPSVNPRSGSFGRITSKSGNRSLQLALKFVF